MKPTNEPVYGGPLSLESIPPPTVAITNEPTIGQMLQSVLQRPQAEQNVAVMERMFDLYEKVEARNAEKEFNAAFVRLQGELPVIVAKTIIPNRGKYERYEDLLEAIGPILGRHGFSVAFSQSFSENRIVETCHLRHVGGHSLATSFAVRTGGRADSDTQADCKAATTAKRYALINALNLVIRQDESMREEMGAEIDGAFITFEQAAYLREQVKETNSNESAFLKFAGAPKYEEIGANKYDMLVRSLAQKARK